MPNDNSITFFCWFHHKNFIYFSCINVFLCRLDCVWLHRGAEFSTFFFCLLDPEFSMLSLRWDMWVSYQSKGCRKTEDGEVGMVVEFKRPERRFLISQDQFVLVTQKLWFIFHSSHLEFHVFTFYHRFFGRMFFAQSEFLITHMRKAFLS